MKKLTLILAIVALTVSCKDKGKEAAEVSRQATIDSMNVVMQQQQAEIARQKTIDSMQAIATAKESLHRQQVATTNNNASANTPAKRKGWSNTAKGAVIGAGVGAISGAVIDKKHGEGAIVGGLAGAALGAGTGAIIDDKKKK